MLLWLWFYQLFKNIWLHDTGDVQQKYWYDLKRRCHQSILLFDDGESIRDSVPWNSRCTKDPRCLNNVFLFSTEIWAEQLKNTLYVLWDQFAHFVCLFLEKGRYKCRPPIDIRYRASRLPVSFFYQKIGVFCPKTLLRPSEMQNGYECRAQQVPARYQTFFWYQSRFGSVLKIIGSYPILWVYPTRIKGVP